MKKLLYILLFVPLQGYSVLPSSTPVCIDPLAENYFSYLDPNNAAWENGFFNPESPNYSQAFASDYYVDNNVCEYIYGCMDATAFNFDITATVDDGSCEPFIVGCMNSIYVEYDSTANTPNDYLCLDIAYYGCMDPIAFNYNPDANVNDDSCVPYIIGCMDPNAYNYEATATADDGSCIIYGCTYEAYPNYNPAANQNDGSCSFSNDIYGCANSYACNYDPDATSDDGSCTFAETYYDCNGVCDNDVDGDGVCDELEIVGCAQGNYLEYWNYTIVSVEGADYYYVKTPINEWVDDDGVSCQTELFEGCIYDNYIEYNPMSNVFDVNLCQTIIVYGCTEEIAFNYSTISNTDDGTCYSVIEGCLDPTAFNFNDYDSDGNPNGVTGINGVDVNTDDGSCFPVVFGCLSPDAYNFNDYDYDGNSNGVTGINGVDVNTDDGSCIERVYGCMDNDYVEYNNLANTDDGSCQVFYSVAYVEVTQENINLNNTIEEATTSLSSLQQALDTWNTTIDLSVGWNMFGYGCPSSIDIADGLSNHTESIIITKDNSGNVYMPEFGFNGIGDFTPGFGYQIKLIEAIEGFSLCDWYVNDIPEDNIVSLQEEVESLQAELDSIYGCIDISACNFDETAFVDDGSCYNNDLGCGCDTPGPIEGYDCDDNLLPIYQVGDYAEGGIVYYVDESGQHGLVAAMEDLPGTYEWGCYNYDVDGADGQAIGTGYQNTLDIVNQGCLTGDGGITAAHAALYAEINGYSDWYLPSRDEHGIMNQTIAYGCPLGIGCLSWGYYWTSTTYNSSMSFQNNLTVVGGISTSSKYNLKSVRPIRSF